MKNVEAKMKLINETIEWLTKQVERLTVKIKSGTPPNPADVVARESLMKKLQWEKRELQKTLSD